MRTSVVPAVLLFVSGLAALVYQTLWVKQLTLVVGVDVHAVTTGVSAFFAGLALGGLLLGRRADRVRSPLRLYAALELGVAALGVGCTAALGRAAPLFAALEGAAGPLAWLLPFALIGLPACLMGGTLPVLVRAAAPAAGRVGRASGLLYGANTAGAILGALATPFALIPAYGVFGAGLVAGGLNLVLAGWAAWLGRGEGAAAAASEDAAADTTTGAAASAAAPLGADARLALGLYAAAGGVAMGYEVFWTQAIVQFLSTRTYAFAVVLATYLAGLALGGALYARFADTTRRPWRVFGLLVGGVGLAALLTFACLGPWLGDAQSAVARTLTGWGGGKTLAMAGRFTLAAGVLVLAPATLLGAAFPAAVRLIASADAVGRDVGAVVALNTLGGIVGTALTGFVLVPGLGLVRSLGLLVCGSALVAGVAWARGGGWSGRALGVAALGVGGLALAACLLPADALARLLVAQRGGELVFYEEGAGGTVAVVAQGEGSNRFRRLYIAGVSNTGDAMPSLRYMRLQALLPLLIHPGEPRAALVVGFGTGITSGALLTYPGLERRVCAELLPGVVRAAGHFEGNYDAARDPRLEVRLRDGRRELLRDPSRYDLITLEPPPPSAAGVVNLYSSDFYALCRRRLAPGGLVAQWWPLATQNDDESRSLVRSLLDEFPHVTLWTTELHEMLVIGSLEPTLLDVPRIAARLAQPGVQTALARVGVRTPAELLATYVTDRAGLERYVDGAPPVTDDRPRIEHAAWVRADEIERVLPRLLALQREPPLTGGATLAGDLATARRRLHQFYRAGLFAYAGAEEQWRLVLRQVLREDGENPYFRWFVGGAKAPRVDRPE